MLLLDLFLLYSTFQNSSHSKNGNLASLGVKSLTFQNIVSTIRIGSSVPGSSSESNEQDEQLQVSPGNKVEST